MPLEIGIFIAALALEMYKTVELWLKDEGLTHCPGLS